MKITAQILTFILFSLFIVGCSITEEITFNANGSIRYSYLIDGSAFMEILPDSTDQNNKGSKDTLVLLSDLFKQQRDSFSKLPKEDQEIIKTLNPLIIKVHKDEEKKEWISQILGDFKNVDSLNMALSVLNDMGHSEGSMTKTMGFLTNTTYGWNGKEFIKTSVISKSMKEDSSSLYMYEGGKFHTKYNFPKKIKKVSDPSALISQDGKSVIVEYDAQEYLRHPEKTNLKVELED
ncbi:MAG: hypothetical protein LBP34_09360 [Flavobacteriaceae bacterium]|jgi:hypothetical protein|nr:hypothetical protein [Flavobacteriaceae bacterium]